MDPEMKTTATDHLLEELVTLQEEADTKAKIALVHILNDVSGAMAKINHEVCPWWCVRHTLYPDSLIHLISSWMPYMLLHMEKSWAYSSIKTESNQLSGKSLRSGG